MKAILTRQDSGLSKGLALSYKTDRSGVRKYYKEIVKKCFHKDDVWAFHSLMHTVKEQNCAVIVVEENGKTLGGCTVQHYWSTGKKIMLIAWLGVKMEHRSRNIGTLLVEEAINYANENGADILLGLVENPELSQKTTLAYGNASRRVQFYTRFDCQRLEISCYIPAYRRDQKALTNYMVTMFPLNENQKTMREFRDFRLRTFVSEFIGNDIDSKSVEFVESCEGTVTLVPFKTLYGEVQQ